MTYRAVKYRYCLSERLVLDARKLLRRALCYVQKGRTELNWARMGYSDWHLLITRLWKTALVGLRLHRLKSNCPPGNQPGFATNRSIEVYLRKILLQSSSNFGWNNMLRSTEMNSCRIRMPSFEFSARMLPVLPEFSFGSSSLHLETCTGSVIHILPRLSFVIRHSTSRSSSLGSEPATDWTTEEPCFDSQQ